MRWNNIFWKIIFALISKTMLCFLCHTILLTASKCHLSMIFTVRIVIVSIGDLYLIKLTHVLIQWLLLYYICAHFLCIRGHSITTFKQFCLFLNNYIPLHGQFKSWSWTKIGIFWIIYPLLHDHVVIERPPMILMERTAFPYWTL